LELALSGEFHVQFQELGRGTFFMATGPALAKERAGSEGFISRMLRYERVQTLVLVARECQSQNE
jgi:hypothetical protein